MRKSYFDRIAKSHEELIIQHLSREWSEAEKALKKHELIKAAQHAGVVAGKTILKTALVAGALVAVAIAPGAFAIFGSGARSRRYIQSEHLEKELQQGSTRKYWRYTKTGEGKYAITLTPRGKKIALRDAFREFKLEKRSVWDGIWRMVMFDIPKKHSLERDALRRKLLEIGMAPLQESVFVYPFPCRDEVEMWVELFSVEGGVEILEARFTDGRDQSLRKLFSLK